MKTALAHQSACLCPAKATSPIADAEAHTYDVLLVYHTSRFARNRADALDYKRRLTGAGKVIVIVFVSQGIISGNRNHFVAEGINEILDERRRTRRLLLALLGELQHNEHIAQQAVDETLPFDYVAAVLDTSCYRRARENGEIADLSADILKEVVSAYEVATRYGILSGRQASERDTERLLNLLYEMPAEFEVAARRVESHIGGRT